MSICWASKRQSSRKVGAMKEVLVQIEVARACHSGLDHWSEPIIQSGRTLQSCQMNKYDEKEERQKRITVKGRGELDKNTYWYVL